MTSVGMRAGAALRLGHSLELLVCRGRLLSLPNSFTTTTAGIQKGARSVQAPQSLESRFTAPSSCEYQLAPGRSVFRRQNAALQTAAAATFPGVPFPGL